MFEISQSVRLWITASVLLGAFVLLNGISHGEPIVPRKPLGDIPYTFAGWTGHERPLAPEVLQAAKVSYYVNRIYVDPSSAAIQLYVGYYASQKTGDTIHSPKNCLPGAGWDPIQSGYKAILISSGRQIVVNEYVIQRNQDKQLVFYWYQGRGRIIANEYAGKFWMMADAIFRNRTDGALIRLNTVMNDGEANARSRLLAFVQLLFPSVEDLIPR